MGAARTGGRVIFLVGCFQRERCFSNGGGCGVSSLLCLLFFTISLTDWATELSVSLLPEDPPFILFSNLFIFSFHVLVEPADEARCAVVVLVARSVLRYIGVLSVADDVQEEEEEERDGDGDEYEDE